MSDIFGKERRVNQAMEGRAKYGSPLKNSKSCARCDKEIEGNSTTLDGETYHSTCAVKEKQSIENSGKCVCGHTYEDHKIDSDGFMPCTKCKCQTYKSDSSWKGTS